MPFISKATPADSVKSASSSPGERGERRNADHSAMTAGSEVGNGHCKGGTGVTGKGSPPKDGTRPATEKSKRSKDVDVESGIAVYCDDGAGKRTFATLRVRSFLAICSPAVCWHHVCPHRHNKVDKLSSLLKF